MVEIANYKIRIDDSALCRKYEKERIFQLKEKIGA